MANKGPEYDISDMISTFSNLDLDLEEVEDRMIELQETIN